MGLGGWGLCPLERRVSPHPGLQSCRWGIWSHILINRLCSRAQVSKSWGWAASGLPPLAGVVGALPDMHLLLGGGCRATSPLPSPMSCDTAARHQPRWKCFHHGSWQRPRNRAVCRVFTGGLANELRVPFLGRERGVGICHTFLLLDQTLRRELLAQRSQLRGRESFPCGDGRLAHG